MHQLLPPIHLKDFVCLHPSVMKSWCFLLLKYSELYEKNLLTFCINFEETNAPSDTESDSVVLVPFHINFR